jgi:hypothetical protein
MNAVWICLYIVVFFIVFFLAEITSYLWHRYLAHPSEISKRLPFDEIIKAHSLHHDGNLLHDASEDFIWIVYGLILIVTIFGTLCRYGFFSQIDGGILIVIVIAATAAFVVNWYFHLVVHTPDHWLQGWSYIKDLQTVHFVHHEDPSVNYSITDFSDTLFGTFGIGDGQSH